MSPGREDGVRQGTLGRVVYTWEDYPGLYHHPWVHHLVRYTTVSGQPGPLHHHVRTAWPAPCLGNTSWPAPCPGNTSWPAPGPEVTLLPAPGPEVTLLPAPRTTLLPLPGPPYSCSQDHLIPAQSGHSWVILDHVTSAVPSGLFAIFLLSHPSLLRQIPSLSDLLPDSVLNSVTFWSSRCRSGPRVASSLPEGGIPA